MDNLDLTASKDYTDEVIELEPYEGKDPAFGTSSTKEVNAALLNEKLELLALLKKKLELLTLLNETVDLLTLLNETLKSKPNAQSYWAIPRLNDNDTMFAAE